VQREVTKPELEPATAIEQVPELVKDTDTSADRRCPCRARDAHFRERAETEDQAGIENNIESVRQHEGAQCDRSVACPAERSIEEKQVDDAGGPAKQYGCKPGTCLDNAFAGAHETQHVRSIESTWNAYQQRQARTDPDCLPGDSCSCFPFTGADAPRHHGSNTHAEADGNRIQHGNECLGNADRGDRIGTETRHKGDVDDSEDRLHRHFEHHRDRQQSQGATDWTACIVGLAVAQRLAKESGPAF
jgi:hypothetical protein